MGNSVLFARKIRETALIMNHYADASHIGGALSMADILAVLYNDILNVNPQDPFYSERDRFLLSKGHSCSALYAALAIKGFFPEEHLKEYSQNGSIFLTHASSKISGVELSTGSLGHALSIGCGIALSAKKKNKNFRTFVLASDGELDEGSNWEAILFAPQIKLDNLILIVDYNKIQSLGTVKDVLDLNPLIDKFIAFRWEAYEVDGHNHKSLKEVFGKVKDQNCKPKVIIANTIKGKGVSFMENRLLWHYKSPNEEQLKHAIDELNKQ